MPRQKLLLGGGKTVKGVSMGSGTVVKSNLKMIIIISLGKSFVLSYIQISDAKDSDVHVSSFKVSALERQ